MSEESPEKSQFFSENLPENWQDYPENLRDVPDYEAELHRKMQMAEAMDREKKRFADSCERPKNPRRLQCVQCQKVHHVAPVLSIGFEAIMWLYEFDCCDHHYCNAYKLKKRCQACGAFFFANRIKHKCATCRRDDVSKESESKIVDEPPFSGL